MTTNRLVAFALAAAAVACGPKATTGPTPPTGERILVNVDAQGVGLGGHDPIMYVAGAATMGSAEHASAHGGATYHFATAENKATFDADMASHAPGYGGYCAYAASQNRLSPSDPTVFLIHDGQLLVFTNQEFLTLFQADPAGHKAKADQNWPGLVAEHGKPAS
jgi:YHS domain-containing protein